MTILDQPMRGHDWPGLVATVWLVGVAALLCDYFQLSRPLIVGARTLFGIAVCASICLALIPKARSLAGAPPAQLHSFTRLVSRWVYIGMYGLALVRVSLNFNLFGSSHSLDDFQFYIACCIVPLWLVRAIVLAVRFNPNGAPSLRSCAADDEGTTEVVPGAIALAAHPQSPS